MMDEAYEAWERAQSEKAQPPKITPPMPDDEIGAVLRLFAEEVNAVVDWINERTAR